MYIGILVPFINNFGKKGYYNSQEVGLGKALSKLGNSVIIYKLDKERNQFYEEKNDDEISIRYLAAKVLGSNGIIKTNTLDNKLDVLICFSDLQLIIPSVYKWCKKNKITFIPYIGVFESHNPNRIIKMMMNLISYRNLLVYRKCCCLAKNRIVYEKLKKKGVTKTELIPVGIDLDLVNKEYNNIEVRKLKAKYNYDEKDKIILFIGRLETEKEPVNLIGYFAKKYNEDNTYRLLIIGEGALQGQINKEISNNKLEKVVKQINKIPNQDIWELYRISDCFINLNKQEIFGMAILESMFYETKTIAWHAPGPDLIIENEVSGFLVSNEKELYCAIENNCDCIKKNAHKRIVDSFTWEKIAKDVNKVIQNNIRKK